jgi:hypothetical protein
MHHGASAKDDSEATGPPEQGVSSRAWSVDESVSANDENELATIRVRTMYG